MRERHRRRRGKDTAFGYIRNGERCDCGQHGDSDMNLRAALIPGRALLQAGVLVNGLATIAVVIGLCKSHGRRRRGRDAGLGNPDRLGKKHPRGENAADCAANCGTAKYHECHAKKDPISLYEKNSSTVERITALEILACTHSGFGSMELRWLAFLYAGASPVNSTLRTFGHLTAIFLQVLGHMVRTDAASLIAWHGIVDEFRIG